MRLRFFAAAFALLSSSLAARAGNITYTYTPASTTAVTPEPSSIFLLGTALLGAAGAIKRRCA